MVSKDYDGTKIPPRIEKDGTIRFSKEYVLGLSIPDEDDRAYLNSQIVGQSICQALFWLNNTERVRRLLKVTDSAQTPAQAPADGEKESE